MPDPPEMHITIVAAGDHSRGLGLANEIEMVKAAVLYADRVTLASPRTSMVAMVGGLSGLPEKDRIELLKSMASQLPNAQNPLTLYEALKRKKYKTRDEVLALYRFDTVFKKADEEMTARTSKLASDAGIDALIPAMEEGLLDLDTLGVDAGDTDVMVQRMTQLIADVVATSSTTLPMFDDGSGGFLRAMRKEGLIPDVGLALATQATVAARLIGWIPAFPDAGMDAVLNARESLRSPLIRYRSAVIGIARQLEVTPIDSGFEGVVRDLHREQVQPALLEIEELSQDLGLMASTASVARAGAGSAITNAAIGFAAAEIAGLPSLLLASAGATADIVARVAGERSRVKRARRQNQFYFLYEADRQLGP